MKNSIIHIGQLQYPRDIVGINEGVMKTVVEIQPDITDKNKELCKKYWLREKDSKHPTIPSFPHLKNAR